MAFGDKSLSERKVGASVREGTREDVWMIERKGLCMCDFYKGEEVVFIFIRSCWKRRVLMEE